MIDNGKEFDWGRVSADYAKYRNIYPLKFYEEIVGLNLCVSNQKVLDLGTGTGVLPINLYQYGANFTAVDSSKNQIEQAKILTKQANMNIEFICCSAENIEFSENTFDVVTACQCFFYFNHEILAPKLYNILKKNGKLLILYMAWLPNEDKIANMSENLILKYNPNWSGCNEARHNILIPDIYKKYFEIEMEKVYDVHLPFTKESWNGRIKACRGIGASLSQKNIESFEKEHMAMLDKIGSDSFNILHYIAISVLKVKK